MNESKMRRRAIWSAMSFEAKVDVGRRTSWAPISGEPPLIAILGSPADPGPSAPTHATPPGIATTSDRNGVRGRLLPSRSFPEDLQRRARGEYIGRTRSRSDIMQMFERAREQKRGRAELSEAERRIEAREAHRQARVDVKRKRLERQRARNAMNAMRAQMQDIVRRKAENLRLLAETRRAFKEPRFEPIDLVAQEAAP